jgi:hypothetical protein
MLLVLIIPEERLNNGLLAITGIHCCSSGEIKNENNLHKYTSL